MSIPFSKPTASRTTAPKTTAPKSTAPKSTAPESIGLELKPAGALAVGSFVIYALGACRTVYVGDSGELSAAAATLGIPHPSGYPLYVLLGKLFTLVLPFGSMAFRLSLMSAFWAALTVGLVFVLGRRLELSRPVAVFGALLVAFGPSFWSQANIQRVYSLNAFFVVLVTALALEWYRTRRIQWMVLAAFAAGLGACNHTFLGVFGLAVGLFTLISQPSLLKRPKHLLACTAAGLAGLLPYAYLPLRSRMEPRLDWGDPDNLERFLAVVVREDFWQRAWMESSADWLPILADYATGLGHETLWLGALLAVLGACFGLGRHPVLLPLLGMAVNLISMGTHGSRSDIFIWHRYYIPSYLMTAILAMIGLQWLVERSSDVARRRAWLALIIPVALLLTGWRDFDRSRFRIAEDFSLSLLETLPPGAHLSASDDNILFVLIYLHLVEGVRPDLDLIMQGVGNADLPNLRFDPDSDPLFFTHHPNWNMQGLELVPVGLVFQTARSSSPLPELKLPNTELDGENDPRVPKDYLTSNLIGHFHYMIGISHETRDWSVAQREFKLAMEKAPDNDVLFYNLGLIYRRNGLLQRSKEAFERSAEINPRRLASNKPARATDRLQEVIAELESRTALEQTLRQQLGLTERRDSAAYHRAMSEALLAADEVLAAKGHHLLALEIAQRKP